MGGAIARGLAVSSLDVEIAVADLSVEKLQALQEEYPRVTVSSANKDIVKDADVVLLAVKPWL